MRVPSWPAGGLRTLLIAALVLGSLAAAAGLALFAQRAWRESRRTDLAYATDRHMVRIAPHAAAPAQSAHFLAASAQAPLIVDLHPWSSNLGTPSGDDGARLDELAWRHGWNYIRPTLTGPNRTPAACCSQPVIDAIDAAIAYARAHARVSRVHLIGGSGGGYTALCGALSGRLNGIADVQAWVPVTDLAAWYGQRPGASYERDIRACTGSGKTLDVAEARRRSPLWMPRPSSLPPIHLFAGVHDGTSRGVVPISHAVRMYDRLAGTPVPDAVLLRLMETRRGPQSDTGRSLQGRRVHLFARSPGVDVTVFEGAHELLGPAAMAIARRDDARGR